MRGDGGNFWEESGYGWPQSRGLGEGGTGEACGEAGWAGETFQRDRESSGGQVNGDG